MEEADSQYVLERDPNLGFGFNLELRGERYFIQSLSPKGPAKKAGLVEYAWIQELNSKRVTGLLPQHVESLINSDVFLLVTARKLSSVPINRELSQPPSHSPHTVNGNTKKFRTGSLLSLNTDSVATKFDLQSRKSLTLSLETLQKLKKMATKKYMDLISQLHTVEGEKTDFKSEQIEKDIAETIQNIKMLERQIVSKTDMRFSSFNIYNLGEVPKDKDKRKKYILERSASDKHLITKNQSKQLFRLWPISKKTTVFSFQK